MRKKIFLITCLFILSGSLAYNTTIYVFHMSGCPHCADELNYLRNLNMPELTIKDYEIYYNESNWNLYKDFENAYNANLGGSVPITYIGNKVFRGFTLDDGGLVYSDTHKAYSGYRNQIYSAINNCIDNSCPDPMTVLEGSDSVSTPNQTVSNGGIEVSELETINLPLIGEVSVTETSIFFLTIIIGLLDGFNPCAMWMLSFLLTFVIATKDRKRVFLIGGIFILVSGIVYFLFITAWLNVFISAATISFFRFLAGGFAIFAGLINIKDFFAFQKGLSLSIPAKWQPKIKKRMKHLANVATGAGMIIGVIILAFTINLVELMCTIGFPVIYLNILTQHGFPVIINYFYITLYVLMYMLDDFVIFLVAVFTLSLFEMKKKHVRYLKLFSGVIMVILALILIIKPELLMFG
ncbi:hypothetical protein GF352_00245 [archaeon]|nr:hypothetical protein [archaeon]